MQENKDTTMEIEESQKEQVNIFSDVRQRFHNVRGWIATITSAADLIRTDTVGDLSEEQRKLLDTVTTNAVNIAEYLESTRSVVLRGLALSPSSGKIWEAPCRVGHDIRQDLLEHELIAIRNRQRLGKGCGAIIVAETETLGALRKGFINFGWRVRTATAPSDVQYLLRTERAELVAMAPPIEEIEDWWLTLRMTLSDMTRLPIMLNVTAAQPY
jgi:hypothetical protein